jgi:hypothetical protein
LIFSPKLATINLEPVFGWFVNRTRRKNAMRIHILALTAALALAGALRATPPPEICLGSEMYITESWDMTNFDLPPPVEGIVRAAIEEQLFAFGVCKFTPEDGWVYANAAIVQINDTPRPSRALLWHEKGLDDFRAVASNDRGDVNGTWYRLIQLE